MQNAHKIVRKVNHHGKDLKNSYASAGRTLFCALKETLQTERSMSNSPLRTEIQDEEEKTPNKLNQMVTKVEQTKDEGATKSKK